MLKWGLLSVFLSSVIGFPAEARDVINGPVAADVVRVIDGDTIEVSARIWPDHRVHTKVRINHIDTPELRGRCESEKVRAEEARLGLIDWVEQEQIYLTNVMFGKFAGRVVADVVRSDGSSAGAWLISQNLARTYEGGRREGWCD